MDIQARKAFDLFFTRVSVGDNPLHTEGAFRSLEEQSEKAYCAVDTALCELRSLGLTGDQIWNECVGELRTLAFLQLTMYEMAEEVAERRLQDMQTIPSPPPEPDPAGRTLERFGQLRASWLL